MRMSHLTDDELDLMLAGGEVPAEVDNHVGHCLVCRRRRDAFGTAVRAALGRDPDGAERAAAREAALARWAERPGHARWWWLAAAAVILLALLIPHRHGPPAPAGAINPDVVLHDVDTVLARDPLASFAPEDVVRTVIPGSSTAAERSSS
ncbi:MAG: hypothetical protein ACM3O7_12250 [Acidobacteriota bacterium]